MVPVIEFNLSFLPLSWIPEMIPLMVLPPGHHRITGYEYSSQKSREEDGLFTTGTIGFIVYLQWLDICGFVSKLHPVSLIRPGLKAVEPENCLPQGCCFTHSIKYGFPKE